MENDYKVLIGDNRETLKGLDEKSVQCVVTSPPYFGLRSYGVGTENGEIGLESTPDEYVAALVDVFREVRRILRDDGTVWLNLGDSYAGYHGNKNSEIPTSATNGWTNGTNENARTSTANRSGLKQKDLIGIPWRVAFALQADGWYLRQDIIWHKPNPMPESVTDRCTKAHEYLFLLSKSARYYFDDEAIKEDAAKGKRNKRSVWTIATQPYSGAHFATFPSKLVEPCILAGSREGDTVLDPFGGSGTVAGVASLHNRRTILCELSPEYPKMIPDRILAIKKKYQHEAKNA